MDLMDNSPSDSLPPQATTATWMVSFASGEGNAVLKQTYNFISASLYVQNPQDNSDIMARSIKGRYYSSSLVSVRRYCGHEHESVSGVCNNTDDDNYCMTT